MEFVDEIDREVPEARAKLAEQRKDPDNAEIFKLVDKFIEFISNNGGSNIDQRSMGHALMALGYFGEALPLILRFMLPDISKLAGAILMTSAPIEGFDEVLRGIEP